MTKAKWVSVSEDGAVWSVWQDGGLYKRVGNGWQKNAHASNVEEVTVGWEINVWKRDEVMLTSALICDSQYSIRGYL